MATLYPGSSVPSGFVLWVMRELPSSVVKQEVRTLAFISENTREIHPLPQQWTAATSLQNQVKVHLFTFNYDAFFRHIHVELFNTIDNFLDINLILASNYMET